MFEGPALEGIGQDASLGRKLQKLRLIDQYWSRCKILEVGQEPVGEAEEVALAVREVGERGIGVDTWSGREKKRADTKLLVLQAASVNVEVSSNSSGSQPRHA